MRGVSVLWFVRGSFSDDKLLQAFLEPFLRNVLPNQDVAYTYRLCAGIQTADNEAVRVGIRGDLLGLRDGVCGDSVRPVGEHDVILLPGTVEKGIDLELILGPGKVCEKLVAYVEAQILDRVSDREAALPAVRSYGIYGLDVFHQAWLIVVVDIIKAVATLLPIDWFYTDISVS